MNFHTVKIGANKYARFFSYGKFCSLTAQKFTGFIAIQPEGYADWTEVPIRELPNNELNWQSGMIFGVPD